MKNKNCSAVRSQSKSQTLRSSAEEQNRRISLWIPSVSLENDEFKLKNKLVASAYKHKLIISDRILIISKSVFKMSSEMNENKILSNDLSKLMMDVADITQVRTQTSN